MTAAEAGSRERYLEVAFSTMERLTDRDRLLRLHDGIGTGQGDLHQPWAPLSLASGDVGLALAFGEFHLRFPDHGWDQVAHKYLKEAAGCLERGVLPNPSLFSGLAGLAFVLRRLAQDSRYAKALKHVDQWLFGVTETLLLRLSDNPFGPISPRSYDLISGMTGVGAYLLYAAAASPDAERLLRTILEHLAGRALLPQGLGFVTSPSLVPEWEKSLAPDKRTAYIDMGLAHGVAGPLALLALAVAEGFGTPKLREAAANLSDWILVQLFTSEEGPNLPSFLHPQAPETRQASRAAWCYGIPGVAAALRLAGEALGDPHLTRVSADLMLSVSHRSPQSLAIPAPILCHGLGGLVTILKGFESRAGMSGGPLAAYTGNLLEQIAGQFDGHSELGFLDLDLRHGWVPKPGLLEGSAGVALALLEAVGSSEREGVTWTRAFLLH